MSSRGRARGRRFARRLGTVGCRGARRARRAPARIPARCARRRGRRGERAVTRDDAALTGARYAGLPAHVPRDVSACAEHALPRARNAPKDRHHVSTPFAHVDALRRRPVPRGSIPPGELVDHACSAPRGRAGSEGARRVQSLTGRARPSGSARVAASSRPPGTPSRPGRSATTAQSVRRNRRRITLDASRSGTEPPGRATSRARLPLGQHHSAPVAPRIPHRHLLRSVRDDHPEPRPADVIAKSGTGTGHLDIGA
jgi:hypothetical protein